jgi:hypothetical protein
MHDVIDEFVEQMLIEPTCKHIDSCLHDQYTPAGDYL